MNKQWYMKYGGKTYGPTETEKIKHLIEEGKLNESAEIADADKDEREFKKIFEYDDFNNFLILKYNNKQYGPYSADTIAKLIKDGKVPSTALVAKPLNQDKWYQINNVKAFSSLFKMAAAAGRCPSCGAANPEGAEYCSLCKSILKEKKEDSGSEQATSEDVKQDDIDSYEEEPFFIVSTKKFTIMSLCTFGIYEYYWFYKNWKFVKKNIKKVSPFWRTVFAIFCCHGLFKIVKEYADQRRVECGYKPDLIAVYYILLSIVWRAPEPLSLISMMTFVPLLSVQKAINSIKGKVSPLTPDNSKFSAWNIVMIVIGIMVWVLVVMGLFVSEEEVNDFFKVSEKSESVKEQDVQKTVIKRVGADKKKWEFNIGEEFEIEGVVLKLDPIDYDNKVFTKSLSVSGYKNKFLVVTEDGQVENALDFIIKKSKYIQMGCNRLSVAKGDNVEGVEYVLCNNMSYEGIDFGVVEEYEDSAEWDTVPVVLDKSNFNEVIEYSHKKPVLIDFHADWCHWCKVLGPTFDAMAQEMKEDVLFARLDTQRHKDIASRYKIRGLPTMILFIDGVAVKVQSGAGRNDSENRQMINLVLTRILH